MASVAVEPFPMVYALQPSPAQKSIQKMADGGWLMAVL